MRKIYLKILIGIVVILWVIYFIQQMNRSDSNSNSDCGCCNNNNNNNKKEGFTSNIKGLYRPYVRTLNQKYESFINNYGSNVVFTKLRKWNIY